MLCRERSYPAQLTGGVTRRDKTSPGKKVKAAAPQGGQVVGPAVRLKFGTPAIPRQRIKKTRADGFARELKRVMQREAA
jgi:hypothetical protein